MANRTGRESKAQVTHVTEMKIVDDEQARQRLKIARLRSLRLAQQAEADKDDRPPEAK